MSLRARLSRAAQALAPRAGMTKKDVFRLFRDGSMVCDQKKNYLLRFWSKPTVSAEKNGNMVALLQNEDFAIPQISAYMSQGREPSHFLQVHQIMKDAKMRKNYYGDLS